MGRSGKLPKVVLAEGTPSPTQMPPMLLVADDFADAREMYSEYLAFLGYRVLVAADGHETLDQAFEHLPALILLDLAMPGIDGWDVARILKGDERTRAIPILALTGHGVPEMTERARRAGCDQVLVKPCLPDQLAAAVRALLGDGEP